MSPIGHMLRLIDVLERLCDQLDRIHPPPASQPKGDVKLASTTQTRLEDAMPDWREDEQYDWRQYGPATGGYPLSAEDWLIERDKHAGNKR